MFRKSYDDQVIDVLARLVGRVRSPDVIFDAIGSLTKQKALAKKALSLVYEAQGYAESLRSVGLISKDAYFFLLSAERSKALKDFADEYREIRKKIKRIRDQFISSMISPILSVIGSVFVMYIFIYRLIPGMNLNEEKALTVLPFYFSFLFHLSHHREYYLFFIGFLFAFGVLLYLMRRRLPVIGKLYRAYERLKLYAYMYLSTTAGYRLETALENYNGELKNEVKKALTITVAEGERLSEALLKALNIDNKVEETLLRSALLASGRELPRSLKDFYEEFFGMFLNSLSRFSELAKFLSFLLAGSIVLFAYVGIYFPLLRALKASLS